MPITGSAFEKWKAQQRAIDDLGKAIDKAIECRRRFAKSNFGKFMPIKARERLELMRNELNLLYAIKKNHMRYNKA